MNNTKTAFLIIRVTEAFKIKIVKKAKNKAKGVSEYLRSILENEI